MALRRFVPGVVRHSWIAAAAAAGLVVLLAWPASRVPKDNSLSVWFVRDDPALVQYREFLGTFGNDEAIVVAYQPPGGLDEREVGLLDEAASQLRAIPGVARVTTPASLAPLLGPDSGDALRRFGLAGPRGAVALVAWMEPAEDIDAQRGAILAQVESLLDRTLRAQGRELHLAGTGVLYDGLNRQTERDGALFLGLATLVLAALLWVVLGTLRAVLLTLAPPLAATAATVGLIGWTGGTLNLVMATLPAIILVIGIADAIHILLEWFRAYREALPTDGSQRRALAGQVVGRMVAPCLITSLTTAVAFVALTSSRMAVIRSLGIYAAAGVTLVWLLVVVGMAAGLSLFDVPPPRRAFGARLARPLARLGRFVTLRRGPVLAGFAALVPLLGFGMGRLRVDTLTIGLLPDDHPIVQDSHWIEENLGAYTPLEFVLETEEVSILDPEVLAGLAAWQDSVQRWSGVERTLSVLDFLALGGNRIPESGPAAEGMLAAYRSLTGDDLSAYLTPDRTKARVTAFVPMGTARDFANQVRALEARAEGTVQAGAHLRATGYLPLYVRIIDYTVTSALTGLLLAFAGIFPLLGLLFRSLRLTLVAIPSNLVAVAVVFGTMGWLGIPLDIAAATVGAIVLGIAVDDTVHYLHRYQEMRKAGRPSPVASALAEAGPAMVLTSVVLVIGLGVMVTAGSLSIVYFGFLTALAVTAALVGDLLLLPALLAKEDRP